MFIFLLYEVSVHMEYNIHITSESDFANILCDLQIFFLFKRL